MNKSVLISTMILVLVISSCSKAPEKLAIREVIDGIEYVHNTAEPLYPDATLSLELELSLGGEDQEGNVILYEPGYMIVDDAENMYIVDRQDTNIKVFDPEGKFIRSIGKKGEGPGEFQFVGHMNFTPDGRLLAMDLQARRTSLFDKTGAFSSSHPWLKFFSQRILVLVTKTSYFVQERVIEDPSDPLSNLELIIDEIDFNGNQLQSISGFKLPEIKRASVGGIYRSRSSPQSPRSIFAGDAENQRFYHCLNDRYQIDVYNSNGKIFRKIDRPYEPLPFTDQDKEQFLARYKDMPEDQRKFLTSIDFPSQKNVAVRLLTEDEGNLWVYTNEMNEESGVIFTAYDIFNKDGLYEKKVWLDMSPRMFRKGKMYILHVDEETDYRYIQRYKMIWSK